MRWIITVFAFAICFINFAISTYGQNEQSQGQSSVILNSEGIACMRENKMRGDVQDEALSLAKENAIMLAASYVKNNTQTGDDSIAKNLEDAYARGDVRILSQTGSGWFTQEQSGEHSDRCYRAKIRAEILPNLIKFRSGSEQKSLAENPNATLSARLWLEKQEFRTNEEIRMFVQGNKDFYALITYKNASGDLLQLLPNPYRPENYLKAGVVYQIPSKNDRFKLTVNAPFGKETIILHAATMPLGNLEITPAGAFYKVKTPSLKLEIKVRSGIDLRGLGHMVHKPVQFSTSRATIWTRE